MSEVRVSCPQCQAQYRLKAEPKPSATLRCTKCGASFSRSGSSSRPINPQPQRQPATAAQAPPAAKTNWGLYAALGAVATLLVVCSVLATVLIVQRNEPAAPGLAAQAAPAEPAAPSPASSASAPPVAEPATSEPAESAAAPPASAPKLDEAEAIAATPATPPQSSPSEPSPPPANEIAPATSANAIAANPPAAEPIAEVDAAPAAPAAAAPAPPAADLAGPPRYQWRKGDVLAYKFEIVADLGDEFDKVSGNCQLNVSAWDEPKPQPKAAVDLPDEIEGPQYSGSAFVVHPDGYLATCAHVVNGAKRVTLNLNEHEYQAEVVAVNQEDDLALLKVKARNLKWLPLADSEKVQLGEDVRVLGYPLTDLLGSNLKVSQGIISGVVMEGGSKRFQIDASVNPGNSGGPVVNGRGEVVGMAASMLASAELSKLAFAVPSGSIRKMLDAQKAAPAANAAAAKAPVDGPALVSRASKSMALVHVRGAVQEAGEGELVTFHYGLKSERSPKNENDRFGMSPMSRIPRGMPSGYGDGRMRFDARGDLLESEGETELPYTVGCLPALMIEPLDANGQNFWSEEGQVTLATETNPLGMRSRLFQPPRGLGMPPGFGGSQQIREAKFRRGYRILERKGNLIVIEKTYAFRTLDDEDAPYLSIDGKGRLTFDQERGCVTAMDYKQTAKRNVDNVSVSIPMRITFSQQNTKDFVAERLPMATAEAKNNLRTRRAAEGEAGRSAEEQVDDLLRSISRQMASGERLISEVSQLGDVDVVPSRQAQVCKVLLQVVASDEIGGGFGAMQALEKWADASCVPALLKLLESSERMTASGAAKILGEIGDPSAAKPLAEAMAREGFGGFEYAQALKKLGPAAEEAVIPLLKDRDEHVRREACEVLGEIGAKRSLKALQTMLADSAGDRMAFQAHSIERAIEEIQRRGSGAAALAEIGEIPNFRKRSAGAGGSLKLAREILADRGAGERERENALRTISETSPPDEATRKSVAALLTRSLSADEDFSSRNLALKALAKWGGPEHEAQLLAILREDEGGARAEVYEALGRVGGERSAIALLEELKKHQRNGRLAPAIAQSLGMAASKPGAAQDAVFELLKSNDIVLRAMAAKAIGEMEGAKAEAALEKLLATESTNMALVEAINGAARHRLAK